MLGGTRGQRDIHRAVSIVHSNLPEHSAKLAEYRELCSTLTSYHR